MKLNFEYTIYFPTTVDVLNKFIEVNEWCFDNFGNSKERWTTSDMRVVGNPIRYLITYYFENIDDKTLFVLYHSG